MATSRQELTAQLETAVRGLDSATKDLRAEMARRGGIAALAVAALAVANSIYIVEYHAGVVEYRAGIVAALTAKIRAVSL